jgi:6-pyruvoyl-tetrahydropterin synthase
MQKNKNYLEDFGPLKKNWRNYIDEELDHHFFINKDDPLIEALKECIPKARLKFTNGDPTTEALALILLNKAKNIFKSFKSIKPTTLKLQETPTNAIEVQENDLEDWAVFVDL